MEIIKPILVIFNLQILQENHILWIFVAAVELPISGYEFCGYLSEGGRQPCRAVPVTR